MKSYIVQRQFGSRWIDVEFSKTASEQYAIGVQDGIHWCHPQETTRILQREGTLETTTRLCGNWTPET